VQALWGIVRSSFDRAASGRVETLIEGIVQSTCVEPLLLVTDSVPSSPLDFSLIRDCNRTTKVQ
jgi:hypothetical protein